MKIKKIYALLKLHEKIFRMSSTWSLWVYSFRNDSASKFVPLKKNGYYLIAYGVL